jgi:hypothetical protein
VDTTEWHTNHTALVIIVALPSPSGGTYGSNSSDDEVIFIGLYSNDIGGSTPFFMPYERRSSAVADAFANSSSYFGNSGF